MSQLQFAYNGIKVRVARNEVAALAGLPNVVAVHAVQLVERDNVNSIPYLNIPTEVWDPEDGLGFTGEGIKIAIIDTGIDYTHADFGGPGTVARLRRRARRRDRAGDPAHVRTGRAEGQGRHRPGRRRLQRRPRRPATSRSRTRTPTRSTATATARHVAGTAAGFGVLADGSTYRGAVRRDDGHRNQLDRRSGRGARRPTSTPSASSAATARPM